MVHKYAFINIWKRNEQKNYARDFIYFKKPLIKTIAPGILRFVSMLLLIFEKGMSKKSTPGILYIWKIDE